EGSTRWLVRTIRGRGRSLLALESGGRRFPAQAMPGHAVFAFHPHHHHRRCGCRDGVGNRGLETRSIRHRAVHEAVEPRHLRQVETEWRGEDLLENILVLRLWQE